MATTYESSELTPKELAELHALPDGALATAQEAAAFLRLKYNTLSWYRCNGGGPKYARGGPKLIRYPIRFRPLKGCRGHRCLSSEYLSTSTIEILMVS